MNFERPGPNARSSRAPGPASAAASCRPRPKARAGSIECRFDTPGVYHFGSDDNGTHDGVVRVANADGSVPVDTPAPPSAQPPIFVPGESVSGGGTTTTRQGSTTQRSAEVDDLRRPARDHGPRRRDRRVRARPDHVEALAKRTDLRAKGKAKLVRVGRVTKTVAAGARVTHLVPINAKAKAALRRAQAPQAHAARHGRRQDAVQDRDAAPIA